MQLKYIEKQRRESDQGRTHEEHVTVHPEFFLKHGSGYMDAHNIIFDIFLWALNIVEITKHESS